VAAAEEVVSAAVAILVAVLAAVAVVVALSHNLSSFPLARTQ
jgi:hypothetical protein